MFQDTNQTMNNKWYLALLWTLKTSHFKICYSSKLLFLLPLSEEQKNNEYLLTIHISITTQEEMGLCVRIETKKNKDLSESTWENILDKV